MNFKALYEKRATLVKEMEGMVQTCETETRAFTDDERSRFKDIQGEIKSIDATLDAGEFFGQTEERAAPADPGAPENREDIETRAFLAYVRGGDQTETRTDFPLTVGNNGAIIPTSIIKRIITRVQELSPVYQMATHYNVGGTLSIPYYGAYTDESSVVHAIKMAYASEFSTLTADAGKFTNIELGGYLAAALALISLSLVNNAAFDLLPVIIEEMAKAVAAFRENELLNGTENKVEGLSGVTQSVTAAATDKVTADELIDLQETIPDTFQTDAVWIMNRATRKAIRKIKNGQGEFLLNRDLNSRWGYTLLGKDVYISENMPTMAAGNTAIYYGDLKGLVVKESEAAEVQVLRESYATKHAVGVLCWMEFDAKVQNAQMLAKLVMAAS